MSRATRNSQYMPLKHVQNPPLKMRLTVYDLKLYSNGKICWSLLQTLIPNHEMIPTLQKIHLSSLHELAK